VISIKKKKIMILQLSRIVQLY